MRRAWLMGMATSLVVSGCIVDIEFDPIGTDASVQSSWTVEGAAPTAANCAALGISNVRVRFFDGAVSFDHPDLVFPCEDGAFDTRPNAVIADGLWTMQLLAIDSAGNTIAEGPRTSFDTIVEGGHIVIPSVDFQPETPLPTTLVTGTWTIDGAAPTAASCASLGVTEIGVDFGAPTNIVAFPCADGALSVEVEPGAYDVQVVALDAAEAVVAMAMEETFTITEGQTHVLNAGAAIDFVSAGFDPRGTDADIDASWTIGGTPTSATACEIAGGTQMRFDFYDVTDTDREAGVTVAMAPCDNEGNGAFATASPVLAAGSYLASIVFIDAAAAEVGHADFGSPEAPVEVAVDDELVLNADIRLENPVLAFELPWASPTGSGTTTCAEAGPVSIAWALYAAPVGTGDSPVYESATAADTCENRLVFSAASGEIVTPGDWVIDVSGDTATGKAWETAIDSCVATVGEGDLVIAACELPYNPS